MVAARKATWSSPMKTIAATSTSYGAPYSRPSATISETPIARTKALKEKAWASPTDLGQTKKSRRRSIPDKGQPAPVGYAREFANL